MGVLRHVLQTHAIERLVSIPFIFLLKWNSLNHKFRLYTSAQTGKKGLYPDRSIDRLHRLSSRVRNCAERPKHDFATTNLYESKSEAENERTNE